MSKLVFYSKPDCCLCDEGLEKVLRVARRLGLTVEKRNILDDPALVAVHGTRVPVVELEGRELGWGRVSEKALERELLRRMSR